jgi:glucokinase
MLSHDASANAGGAALVPVLEVGGTHATAAVADLTLGRLAAGGSRREPLPERGTARQLLDAMASCAGAIATVPGATWGVAIPGPFDYRRGIGLFNGVGKFDALYGVDVGRELAGRIWPRPARLIFVNDASAFLIGEWIAGAARGHARSAAITLGTGVGSAFLAGGALVEDGPDVPPEGRVDLLTVNGRPLEDTVSRRAIRACYARATGSGPAPEVREIAYRARAGDITARSVLDAAFLALGQTVGPWIERFRATVLVIGGSMAASWDLMAEPLIDGLKRAAPWFTGHASCVPASSAAEAPIIGAAWHAAGAHRRSDGSPV